MANNLVHLVYFSPTGTSSKVAEAVAEGIKPLRINRYDLTCDPDPVQLKFEDGIALIATPVYAGRVPVDCLRRLEGFSAGNIPTVLIALYGNRDFEDALVELRDVVTEKGFKVVAAGAFIGEHSYSTSATPIAVGRPDGDDLASARKLGQQIGAKLKDDALTTPAIDGKVPYRERGEFGGIAPETNAENCILCGQCAAVCPVDVIAVAEQVTTNEADCIMCAACVRVCAPQARTFTHPVLQERRQLLVKNCSTPKAPKLFV